MDDANNYFNVNKKCHFERIIIINKWNPKRASNNENISLRENVGKCKSYMILFRGYIKFTNRGRGYSEYLAYTLVFLLEHNFKVGNVTWK